MIKGCMRGTVASTFQLKTTAIRLYSSITTLKGSKRSSIRHVLLITPTLLDIASYTAIDSTRYTSDFSSIKQQRCA